MVEKAASTNITVSITGETGSGKEVIAKAIHYNSDRSKNPFVAVNVAAIPKDLMESELFGHEKGAFTSANTRRIGKFEEADKGTLFLDEIAELDINLQTKLLRALQEREIVRVGGNQVIPINVRIIVATNKNLMQEVHEKNFREDLYYRLLGLPIEIAPLRERDNDILILAKYFIDGFCRDNKINKKTLTEEAQQKLMGYNFPGNVRELKSIIDLAIVMSDGENIEAQHIMKHLLTVNEIDGKRSHWEAVLPGSVATIKWDAEIVKETPDQLIGWQSVPQSTIENAGKVEFNDAPGGGTDLEITISYRPPAGDIGAGIAKLFNPVFRKVVTEDIKKFKDYIENRDTPTYVGQSAMG